MTDYKALTTPALIEAWASDAPDRDDILTEMKMRTRTAATEVWPSAAIAKREEEAGLYPDPDDPQFAARLYEKREFYEARAVAAGVADGTIDPCTSAKAEAVFELTPVQRIVSRFMHPLTPYQGMLLFHGVGVGKTCSAVTIAEQFLESRPTSKVIVLVPQALKENFKRTVFDPTKLQWDDRAGSWTTNQCTGTAYLERLDLMENKDLKAVTYKIEEDRRNRYTVTGYQAFANWIDRTLKKSVPMGLTDPAVRLTAENEVLRRLFSDHLIIVDEAHNMRDLAESPIDTSADAAVKGEAAENAGGKALNPFLRRIVLNAEGLRLVLMSATPMYNSAPEIVLLLNYLLLNDTKSEKSAMRASDMFTRDGELRPGAPQRLLEKMARRYVSYMRGENPYTFPLRMRSMDSPMEPASMWPAVSATKNPVILTEHDTATLNALPLVFTEPVAGSPVEQQLRGATSRGLAPSGLEEGEAVSDVMLDLRMQMANITYPNSMYGTGGFDFYFTRQTVGGSGHKLRSFSPKGFDVDSVFAGEGLRMHAPKIHRVVESIKSARGICFAYSRYIKAGALPLAIALERAGFQRRLADGRIAPLLSGVAAAPPVCAVCGLGLGLGHDQNNQEGGHPFKPACYVLLTSEEDISPNFAGLVRQATNWPNDPEYGPVGSNVKVILGSQVASEGLDLKCIREMHILDSWYHLNRTDQIIGRAIRYCSHTALRAVETRQGLPLMALNNCLIYMHVALVPETTTPAGVVNPAFETADMYAYRIAIGKAQMVGRVQRLLKKHAWDCNLELEAITFAGLPPRIQQDAQGNNRRSLNDNGTELDGYSINDQDYTTYCDYEVCKHECAVSIAAEGLHLDSSTFSVTDARRLVLAKQSVVRRLFQDQVMVPETVIQDLFGDLPWEIASEALMELIDGRRFTLRRPDGVEGYLVKKPDGLDGFLVKKAGYLVFQPVGVSDTDIPITMRYAKAFQMRRHVMDSRMPVFGRAEEAGEGLVQRKKIVGTTVGTTVENTVVAEGNTLLVGRWGEWLAYVNSGGTMKFPPSLSFTLSIWSWILQRYAAIPEMRKIALRWWFDKTLNYAEQRALLELAATGPVDGLIEGLQTAVSSDMFRSKQLVAYRIFNPNTLMVEHFCKQIGSSEPWTPCAPNIAGLIDNSLGNKAVAIPGETGTLLGFLAAKKGKLIFKTLDTTKQKKHSSVGAECGNMSNLGEHHPRVRMLHDAGRATALKDLMLPDSIETWTQATAKDNNMTPNHMMDITHQPLCLYMEVLTRLFDALRLGGRRWFLSSIDVVQSGLKGKK